MEEALHDVPLFREFAGLSFETRLPDESTIPRFRHLLEEHKIAERVARPRSLTDRSPHMPADPGECSLVRFTGPSSTA